jgi:hypothetical protein
MCTRHILDELVTALLMGVGLLGALRRGRSTCSRTHDAPTPDAIAAPAAALRGAS